MVASAAAMPALAAATAVVVAVDLVVTPALSGMGRVARDSVDRTSLRGSARVPVRTLVRISAAASTSAMDDSASGAMAIPIMDTRTMDIRSMRMAASIRTGGGIPIPMTRTMPISAQKRTR